jgi:hypothetical protein
MWARACKGPKSAADLVLSAVAWRWVTSSEGAVGGIVYDVRFLISPACGFDR